ncbi:MAG: hypothetical protein JSW08_00530 [archaeon]|nr:MAG: hypothetical protein JSW08_00530 [archaeon]
MKRSVLDKYYSEHRHNRRYAGTFWMFVVIAIVLGVTLALAINTTMTSRGIFDFIEEGGSGGGGSVPVCLDTDNGINIFVTGSCQVGQGGAAVDLCVGEDMVREQYCSNSHPQTCISTDIRCPSNYHCRGGSCVLRNTTVTYEGVLDMLNTCEVINYNGPATRMSCDDLCSNYTKTCIDSYHIFVTGGVDWTVNVYECSTPVVLNQSFGGLACNCCTTP